MIAAGVLALVTAGASAQNINGAGATFPYPIYSKWFSEYSQLHPNVKINYQSIGSGGGIRQVSEGTVDFGASDVTMTDQQLSAAKVKVMAHSDRSWCGGSGLQRPRRQQGTQLLRRRDRRYLPRQDHQVERRAASRRTTPASICRTRRSCRSIARMEAERRISLPTISRRSRRRGTPVLARALRSSGPRVLVRREMKALPEWFASRLTPLAMSS